MIEVTRRELAQGAAIIGSLASASAVSACSPRPVAISEPYRRFFQAVARREYSVAENLLDDATRLIISRENDVSVFAGKNIIAPISNLVTEGWRFFGDTDDRMFGGYWNQVYPWSVGNMIPRGKIEFSFCGADLAHSVFNVFVRGGHEVSGGALRQIMIFQSGTIATGLGGGILPPDLSSKSNNG